MFNSSFHDSIALLRTRRFGTFWVASLLANIGTWAQQVAQPWLLLSLGASSVVLGLDTFALGAPGLLLVLIGGALADRADRRRTIALFQSVQMLCPLTLVVLILTGAVRPWMVIVLSLVVGVTDALSMPSFQSIVPTIVERDQIPSGIALNSTQFNLSRMLGPAFAGMLIAGVGLSGAFALSAASYLPFILVALWVLPRGQGATAIADGFDRRQMRAAIRDVLREPALRGALITVLTTALLCAPLITFCPLLIKEVFQGDASDFSLAMGSFGLGGLAAAMGLLAVDPHRDRRPLANAFAVSFGAVVALAALTPWAWTLPALLVLAGVAMTASNASANALLQSTAPPTLRGQTVSLFMLCMRGGMALGGLGTGAMVHLLGVRQALLVNGILAIAAQVVVGRAWSKASIHIDGDTP